MVETPAVEVDILEDGAHFYVRGVIGDDGSSRKLMSAWRDGRTWTVELANGDYLNASTLRVLATRVATRYRVTGLVLMHDEMGQGRDRRFTVGPLSGAS